MSMMTMSSPWMIYYREVCAMFEKDDKVHVVYKQGDGDNDTICLYVEDPVKADAIEKLLPEEKEYGNIIIEISVIPCNADGRKLINNVLTESADASDLFRLAFRGNPVLSFVKKITGIMTNDIVYVVFAKEVVQYFNDDLCDVNGLCTTLYQDIASRIFNKFDGVFYCTDNAANDSEVNNSRWSIR